MRAARITPNMAGLLGMVVSAAALVGGCLSAPVPPERLPPLDNGMVRAGAPEWCRGVVEQDGVLRACGGQNIAAAGGRAAAEARASQQAFIEIARQLDARVTSELIAERRLTTIDGRTQISRTLIERSEIAVENLPITGLREDRVEAGDAGASVYVLATLDRRAAQAELRRAIDALDADIAALSPAMGARDPLSRARALYPAFALVGRRARLEEQLALVGVTEKRRAKPPAVAEVERAAIQAVDNLTVRLRPEGPQAAALAPDLRQALREQTGLSVQDTGRADVAIVYQVRGAPVRERIARIYAIDADLSGTVRDGAGTVLNSFQHAVAGFGPSDEDAMRDAFAKLAALMADNIADALFAPSAPRSSDADASAPS